MPRLNKVLLVVMFVGLAAAACSKPSSPLSASGPFTYPSGVTPPLARLAILVTVTNQGTDDMQINPADFLARDADHHIFPANPTATTADGNLVRLTTGPRLEMLPLPTVTLRQSEILSGFIVFDVPQGAQPVELIWRQSDTDQVAQLAVPS
jgi:uncharacterized protein DUF4352